MRLILIGALLSFSGFLFSQTITLTDQEDGKPVSDVAVYNRNRSVLVYSNASGKVDIGTFSEEEVLCFHHFSFERICFTIKEIREAGYRIALVRKVFPIGEFVVSASRWEQERQEVPNKISMIEAPVISFRDPQTAADLIAASEEVYVQKSQLGGGSPMIRGFATNRVLIVVDGVRLNNAIYREGNIQNIISLDPASVESTEIIFGPGAVVYGSDAIGGVMDFHTKKALFSTGDRLYFRAEAMTRYSSANNEKTVHADFTAGSKKIAFLSGITFSDYGDLKMGSRKNPGYLRKEYVRNINGQDSVFVNPDPELQVHSGYSQINTMNKLRFRISDRISLDLANHYSALSQVPRYDRLIQYRSGRLRFGDWYYGPQVWMMNSLHLTYSGKKRLFDQVRFIAAFQNYKESRHDRAFGNNTMNEQFEKLRIFSLNTDFEKKFREEKELLYYGFEYVNNDIESDARTRDIISGLTTPAGTRYPNGRNSYNSISAYAGFKSNISGHLTVNTGLRYNFVSLYSTIADNSFYNFPFTEIAIANSSVTGSAGIVWRPGEKTRLSMNGSTGFRAPNLDDAGKVFESAPGIVVVPNPDLRPEYAFNADLGLSRDIGSLMHFEITGFFTWLKNAMARHDFIFNGEDSIVYQGELSKVEAIVNAGYARVYGFSANIQVNILKHLYLKSSVSVTEGIEKGGVPLRHATPVFGSLHLVYEYKRFKTDIFTLYNGPKKFEKMAPSEISKPYIYAADKDGNPWSPGWCTVNFKTSLGVAKWITVNAGIENIFDVRYRPYSSGIVSPGRNFILSLRVKI